MISYAYDMATVSKDKDPSQVGINVPNAPRNSSSSWIKYSFSKKENKGFAISMGHSFVAQRTTLDPTIILPSYFLLNGGISYGFKKISAAVVVNNITNQTYWMSAYNNINKWPGAPANIMFNLGFKF
jgi:iron complex outermembrane receptor protein